MKYVLIAWFLIEPNGQAYPVSVGEYESHKQCTNTGWHMSEESGQNRGFVDNYHRIEVPTEGERDYLTMVAEGTTGSPKVYF